MKTSVKHSPSHRITRKVDWWRDDGDPDLYAGIHLPKDYVEDIIRTVGLADGFHEESLRAAWAEIVGDFVAAGTFPDSLKHGTLTVRVTQSTLRFHLEQLKTGLLQKLRANPGGEKIKTLRFTFG